MNLSFKLGKLHLSFGAERSAAPPLQRSFEFAKAWLRGEEWTANQAFPFVSPYQQSVWVYTVVSALAQTVSAIPFRISQGDRSGENLVKSGPIIALFNQPHPYLNRYRFWEFIVTWYCLRGEAFLVALDRQGQTLPINSPIANPKSQIQNLLVLPPDQFRHIIQGCELLGWRFTASSVTGPLASMDLAPEDVIHDFLPNP